MALAVISSASHEKAGETERSCGMGAGGREEAGSDMARIFHPTVEEVKKELLDLVIQIRKESDLFAKSRQTGL
ncbi:MAG: hypothetical protein HQL97_16940 [Magnetococcales bacterium]|nr:hypothetical protein [Magnetococcales bacterium]